MCARYTLADPVRAWVKWLGRDPQLAGVRPRYNVAPTQPVPAIRGGREPVILRWGLVPPWQAEAKGARYINARVETLADQPAFRGALAQRRCVIIADGYYEWTGSKSRREPHRVVVDDGASFGFAGLWERWRRGDQVVESWAIVTCPPSGDLAWLHDRMPVVLANDEAVEIWLQGDVADALAVATTLPSDRTKVYPVSPAVNKVSADEPYLIEPVWVTDCYLPLGDDDA
jgi:putative SOS response-associated peptidase YedK